MEQPGDKESNEKNGETAIDATHDSACGGKGALMICEDNAFLCASRWEAAAGKGTYESDNGARITILP